MNEFMYAIAGIFDMIVVVIYFDSALKRRSGRWISLAIFGILFATCIGSYFWNMTGPQELVIIWSVATLFGLSFLYEGTVLKRIFHVIFTQMIAMISESVCVLLNQIPFLDKMMNIRERDSINLIVSKLFFLLFVVIVLLLKKQHGNIPKKHLLYFLFVPLISAIVVYGLVNGQGGIWGISLLGVLFLNIIVYYILSLLSDYSSKQAREEVLQKQIEMQRDNYEQMSQSFKRGNRLLHDVNKHLRQIGEYLNDRQWEQATAYLKQIEGSLQKNYKIIKTGNIVLDSILSNLKSQLDELNVTFVLEMHVDVSRLMVDDYDFVIILGNVADNVVEAMKEIKQGVVFAQLETTEDALLLYFKNPFQQGKRSKCKKEQWFHGLGIQNIIETVEKYGGSTSFEEKEEEFHTMIMIPYGRGRKKCT